MTNAFVFTPMDETSARAITGWRYQPPYDIYNLQPDEDVKEAIAYLVDPQIAFYTIRGCVGDLEGEELLAYCSFGQDAQVAGGDYGQEALDIGLGVRPDLTGQGHGLTFVAAVLDFARRHFNPIAFRVTIAAFNERAQRVWQKAGFRPTQTFRREYDGRPFVILIRGRRSVGA